MYVDLCKRLITDFYTAHRPPNDESLLPCTDLTGLMGTRELRFESSTIYEGVPVVE